MLSRNIEDLTPSTPFRDLILATNLCQGSDGHIYIMCIRSMSCNKRHKKTYEVHQSQYLCCISYGNMKYAN